MRRAEAGAAGRAALGLLGLLAMLGLLALVVYMRSDINRRQYRLSAQAGTLWVERGRFLPLGFVAYDPESSELRAAYAPVQLPRDEVARPLGPFDERADLDRALFGLLSGWARSRLQAEDVPTLELAATYIHRLSLLPGLSEEQRVELRGLRAGLAYRSGLRLLHQVGEVLQQAHASLQLAIDLGSPQAGEARALMAEVSRRLAALPPLPPMPAPTVAPSSLHAP